MNTGDQTITDTTAADRAAAAAWIARLHGENRTPQVEAGLRRWLAADPAHRRAFELASDLWVEAERWPKRQVPQFVGWHPPRSAFSAPRMLAAAALVLLMVGGVVYWRSLGIATGLGEQRNLTLSDGTRVALNTSTEIRVRYSRAMRQVELERGEAMFEVAKIPGRPFVVTAGGRQVTAVGTAFVVRRDDERVAVTLLQGEVRVESPRADDSSESHPANESTSTTAGESFTLSPGQRLSFSDRQGPQLDRPALEKVTAWQHGEVILDHTPLADAVAEMNRYSAIQLSVEDPEAREVRVTGIFRAGDSASFALAVSETYRLKAIEQDGTIVLTGVPKKRRPAM